MQIEDLDKMDVPDLVELLLRQTERHTELLLREASYEEYTISKAILFQIHQELDVRRHKVSVSKGERY